MGLLVCGPSLYLVLLVYLSVCLSVCPRCLCLSVCLSAVSLLACLSACLPVCLSAVSLLVCLSLRRVSACLFICLSVCLSVCLSIYLSLRREIPRIQKLRSLPLVCLSVRLPACQSVSLYVCFVRRVSAFLSCLSVCVSLPRDTADAEVKAPSAEDRAVPAEGFLREARSQ